MSPGNGSGEKKIYISFAGLPLTFDLKWPFHRSTSGSDWHVLHGKIQVENTDGLHASVAVNLSTTVAEVMPSLEPKDAEAPVINARWRCGFVIDIFRKEEERSSISTFIPSSGAQCRSRGTAARCFAVVASSRYAQREWWIKTLPAEAKV